MTRKTLTREQILAPRQLPREFVEVPEWGEGGVWIQVMTGAERDAYEMDLIKGERTNVRARLLVHCVHGENGACLFKPEDADRLGRESSVILDRLSDVALRINKLTTRETESNKEKSAPNLGAAQSSDSP